MNPAQRRIERVFSQADAIDLAEGLVAYERYHLTLQQLAAYYGYNFERVVACFVSLSPNNTYDGNLRSLVSILQGDSLDTVTVSTFRHCAERAWAYLHGDRLFLDVTKGKKIRNFYHNITKPHDANPVTIDGHAVNIWRGSYDTLDNALAGRLYDQIANDYCAVARRHALRANQVQAVTWFTWKRLNRIVFQPQLHLFDRDDQWRTLRPPTTIRPFINAA